LIVGVKAAGLLESIEPFVDLEDVLIARIIGVPVSLGLFEVNLAIND
jgi:hypothetical protein